MKCLSSLIVTIFIATSQTSAYRARVVEYASYYENTEVNTMLKNIGAYENKIAENDDIVVFPEYGLTGTRALTKEKVKASAILVPDPKDKVIPCQDSTTTENNKVLKALSCMVEAREVWVVVNVMEQDPSSKSKIYNTNIVFDRKGTVYAKYRKINLYEEENNLFTPGKDIVTFTTDFHVTFGLITCADIIFKYPALDILNGNVTDIIFPTAWYSTLPLSAALSVQHGYARRTGVNLLAANYYNPEKANGGSGIYLANKDKEMDLGVTAGIEKVVPNISNRKPDSSCDEIPDSLPDISPRRLGNNFHAYNDFENDTSAFNYKLLDTGVKMFSENVCSKDDKLCCKLDAQIFNPLVVDGPRYTFFAYNRGKQYGCGLAYCTGSDIRSCGRWNNHTLNVNFQKITVTAEKFKSKLYDVPITTDFSLLPTDGYKYCSGDQKITLEAASQTSLLSFGIFINNNAVRAIGGFSVAVLLCSFVALFNL